MSDSSLQQVRALLFDIDGTLYRQKPLRRVMMLELFRRLVARPWSGRRVLRILTVYRQQLERLREEPAGAAASLYELQLQRTVAQTGLDEMLVRSTVTEWMEERPLRHLPRFRRQGLDQVLALAKERGWPVGVFSDYPTAKKVAVLGMGEQVCLQLCGLDAEVGALKPDPRGFLLACERLQLPAEQVLYIGDRQELDQVGAQAAGMPDFLVTGETAGEAPLLGLCRMLQQVGGVSILLMLLCLTSCAMRIKQDSPIEDVRNQPFFRAAHVAVAAFWVPVATLRYSSNEDQAEPDIGTGGGFGVRLGIGDDDQAVSLVYASTSHDEETQSGDVRSHAGYLDFRKRTMLWAQGDWRTRLTVHAGVGAGVVKFDPPFQDVTGVTGQIGALLDLQFRESLSLFFGYAGVLWYEPDEASVYGHELRLGGEFTF